jgi:secreted trypsin-like serine protease
MKLRRALMAFGLATFLTAGTAVAASAITGGEVDGDGHPNVALIAFYTGAGRSRCTATLVSPTVLVTAAHCTDGTVGKTAVTFETLVDDAPPADLPGAADPAAGYTAAELADADYLSGTAHTHPAYSHFTDKKNWNDVGVVVLDSPVTDIEPATIAPSGYLDQFRPNVLSTTLFTTVGYGTEISQAGPGPHKPTPQDYPIVRRFAQQPGQKLSAQLLQVNGNDRDPRGTGGTCYGDSGGPAFHDGYQVSVTSYGLGSVCRNLDGLQRIDIPVVQDWLATFGVAAG